MSGSRSPPSPPELVSGSQGSSSPPSSPPPLVSIQQRPASGVSRDEGARSVPPLLTTGSPPPSCANRREDSSPSPPPLIQLRHSLAFLPPVKRDQGSSSLHFSEVPDRLKQVSRLLDLLSPGEEDQGSSSLLSREVPPPLLTTDSPPPGLAYRSEEDSSPSPPPLIQVSHLLALLSPGEEDQVSSSVLSREGPPPLLTTDSPPPSSANSSVGGAPLPPLFMKESSSSSAKSSNDDSPSPAALVAKSQLSASEDPGSSPLGSKEESGSDPPHTGRESGGEGTSEEEKPGVPDAGSSSQRGAGDVSDTETAVTANPAHQTPTRSKPPFSRRMLMCCSAFQDYKQAVLRCKMACFSHRPSSWSKQFRTLEFNVAKRLDYLEWRLLKAVRRLTSSPAAARAWETQGGESLVVTADGHVSEAEPFLESLHRQAGIPNTPDSRQVASFPELEMGPPTTVLLPSRTATGGRHEDPEVWYRVACRALLHVERCC